MNNSLDGYNINYCLESELPELQQFINDYWKNNHVLATSKKLMDWQHYDDETKIYNFIIAKHNKTNRIHAILGFIPTYHYDKSIKNVDLWLTIWKVRDEIKFSGLGLILLNFLVSKKHPHSISVTGINKETVPVYKHLGYTVGLLDHYYIVNEHMKTFFIIEGYKKQINLENKIDNKKFILFINKTDFICLKNEIDQLLPRINRPQKSYNYIYNRYLCHPIYKYLFYGIIQNNALLAIIIIRLISYKSSNILRLVDFIGKENSLNGIYNEIEKLLVHYNAEYIDFYNYGFNEKSLLSNGFKKRELNSDIVIPNYFEPFEKMNVDLHYAFKCCRDYAFIINKGDGDQDRPNIIENNI